VKKLFCLLSSLLILTFGCDDNNTVIGSGNIIEDIRDLPTFDEISANAAIDLTITQGPEQRVTVQADDNVVPFIATEVTKGELRIDRDGASNFRNSSVSVEITVPTLAYLALSASSDALVTDFEFEQPVFFDLSSSSDLVLSGSKAKDVVFNLTASSNATVTDFIVADRADFDLSSASDLRISGSVHRAIFKLNSASDVAGFDFEVGDCEVDLNSSSELETTVNDKLSGELKAASTLRYRGTPEVTISVGSASELINAN
jgi:hypothetical protein